MAELQQKIPGEAMDTLKTKIVLLKKEGHESSVKMAAAEKAKEEAEERIKKAEKQIREISKAIHTRKILLDENTEKLLSCTRLSDKKEEATEQAREEIKTLTTRESFLQTEVTRVHALLPATSASLCAASERADQQLAEVKKLELTAMLTDQAIEEMEQHLHDAHNMTVTTEQKYEDMSRKLVVRSKDLEKTIDRADKAKVKLEDIQHSLKQADRKMAGLQFHMEDTLHKEGKYKKHVHNIKLQLQNAEQRSTREEDNLQRLKQRMEIIELRRQAKEEKRKEEKSKNKK